MGTDTKMTGQIEMNCTARLLFFDTYSRSKNSKQIQQTVQNGLIHIFTDNKELSYKDKIKNMKQRKNLH